MIARQVLISYLALIGREQVFRIDDGYSDRPRFDPHAIIVKASPEAGYYRIGVKPYGL
jgi:hypothetical protein